MPLAAGSQATLVRIQRATQSRDPESNEVVSTWADIGKAWVSFDPRTGGEYYEAGSRFSQTVENVSGNWMELKNVQPSDRLVCGVPERVLDIKTVLPDNDRRGRVKLQCVAGEGAR